MDTRFNTAQSITRQDRPRVAVLGAGNRGTALAHALASQGCDVAVWDPFPEVVKDIETRRENRRSLPGILLHPTLRACASATACAEGAALVVMSVPSMFIESTLAPVLPTLRNDAVLLNVAKSFARGSADPLVCGPQQQAAAGPKSPIISPPVSVCC